MSLLRHARLATLISLLVAVALVAPASSGSSSALAVPPRGGSADCASTTFGSMTRAQRVGQLFLLGIGAGLGQSERQAIRNRHLGSVTFAANVRTGRAAIKRITDAVQALATSDATAGARFLIAANQEGGLVQALGGPGFATIPSALAQGRLGLATQRKRAARWGRQLLRAGVNLNLAPVGDVVPLRWVRINAPIGQLRREFGHTPKAVKGHVRAFIRGMHDAGVATTVKHFPGLGRVRGNTDFSSGVRDTVTTRHDAFLAPFTTAVKAEVPFVMMSLASYRRIDPGRIAAFSTTIMSGMLRGDQGFDGVIVSDDLSAVAVRHIAAGQRAVRFINAGGDMITVTRLPDAKRMVQAIVKRMESNATFRNRANQSAQRILEAKDAAGLLPCS